MQKKIVGATAALALMAGGGAALAEEMQGEVLSYDESSRILMLQDGQTYSVSEDVAEFRLQEGDMVYVTVAEQDGELVVTDLEKVAEGTEMESEAEAIDEGDEADRAARAREMQAEVVSSDEPSKILTLQNGESYTVSEGVAEFRFHEGDIVKLTVEEQNGAMVVTELEKISEGAEVESGAEALEEEGVQ